MFKRIRIELIGFNTAPYRLMVVMLSNVQDTTCDGAMQATLELVPVHAHQRINQGFLEYLCDCYGRHQNTSVEIGDFLLKNVKCMLVEFCRSVTPSPHVMVKGHLGDDSCCYTILGNVFLSNGGSSHQPSAKA